MCERVRVVTPCFLSPHRNKRASETAHWPSIICTESGRCYWACSVEGSGAVLLGMLSRGEWCGVTGMLSTEGSGAVLLGMLSRGEWCGVTGMLSRGE